MTQKVEDETGTYMGGIIQAEHVRDDDGNIVKILLHYGVGEEGQMLEINSETGMWINRY